MKRHRPNPTQKKAPKDAALKTEGAPDKSYATKVFITPALAKQWLEKNAKNRPCRPADSLKLQRAISLGAWEINGETIKFDDNGDLRDGQTRLNAIAETGVSVWCWVVFDISSDSKTFETIDSGRLRTLGHLLAIRDCKNYNAMATAIFAVYNLDDTIPNESGGFTPQLGLRLLEERPSIAESLAFVMRLRIRDIYSSGTSAALYHLMELKDPDLAGKFWEAIGTGVIANKRCPAKVVRETLLTNRALPKEKRSTDTTMRAICIKGWNLMRAGRTCSYIRWNSENESFPAIL